MDENTKIERWIFRGNHLTSKKKVSTLWQPLDENDKLTGKELIYELKQSRWAIGGIYEVEVKREGDSVSMYSGTLRYIKQFPDADLIQQLKANQLIFEETQRRSKFEAKHKTFELPSDWEEIVELYEKVSFFDRDKFEGLVLVKLRRDMETLKKEKK